MKKILLSFTLILFVLAGHAQQTVSIPEAPAKVEFANVQIHLNQDTRNRVNTEIFSLLGRQNAFYHAKIERMQLYFPIIEKILLHEGVPDDFKYLAVVESALVADAVSPTNAVGYWQFKDFTADEMGLTINKNQDDRKNIHLSTTAAAKYLKKNNDQLNNWISSTLAYSIGAGAAKKIVPANWAYSSEIKFDAVPHAYIIKALAHKIAYSHALSKTNLTDKVMVEYPAKGKSFANLAKELNVSEADLKRNNTWIRSNHIPTEKDYIVIIPSDRSMASAIELKKEREPQVVAATSQSSTPNTSSDVSPTAGKFPKLKRVTALVTGTDQPIFYEINDKKGILAQPGDQVSNLAYKSKINITKFLSYNDMTDRDQIKEGTVYYLQKKHKRAAVPKHTLGANETLWNVSHNYGLRLKNLVKYNRIAQNETIKPGRVLWLQKKRPKKTSVEYQNILAPPPEIFAPETTNPISEIFVAEMEPEVEKPKNEEHFTHRVLENETLYSLATKYNTTVDELRKINNLKPNEGVKYNQRILVPYHYQPEENWVEDVKEVSNSDKKPITRPANTNNNRPSEPKKEASKTNNTGTHTVSSGETLFSIANRYNTTVVELRRLNNISASETIKTGQRLVVPGGNSFEAPAANSTNRPSNVSKSSTHTVQRGETLFSISNKYNMSVDELKSLNGISNNTISVGQKLKIAGNASIATGNKSNAETSYHTVKSGETLFSISNKYGVSVEQLKVWNNLKNNNIQLGSRLVIKK